MSLSLRTVTLGIDEELSVFLEQDYGSEDSTIGIIDYDVPRRMTDGEHGLPPSSGTTINDLFEDLYNY